MEEIAAIFGLDTGGFVSILVIAAMICQVIGKLIPDDAVGFPGFIRKVTKVLGLYVSNKVTSTHSVSDYVRERIKY